MVNISSPVVIGFIDKAKKHINMRTLKLKKRNLKRNPSCEELVKFPYRITSIQINEDKTERLIKSKIYIDVYWTAPFWFASNAPAIKTVKLSTFQSTLNKRFKQCENPFRRGKDTRIEGIIKLLNAVYF